MKNQSIITIPDSKEKNWHLIIFYTFNQLRNRHIKNGTSLFWTDSIIDTYANTLLERLGKISLGILMFEMYLCKKTGKLNGRNSEEEYDYYNNNF